MRNSVYTNKKDPNGDPHCIFFISENLPKYRTELVKNLSQLKYSNQIYTYWTSDGQNFNTFRFLFKQLKEIDVNYNLKTCSACQDLHALQFLSKSDFPSRSYCPFFIIIF
jgi:hypothetical protein